MLLTAYVSCAQQLCVCVLHHTSCLRTLLMLLLLLLLLLLVCNGPALPCPSSSHSFPFRSYQTLPTQVSEPIYAVTQLAQTTMRSELGKMSLDRTFEERESLNSAIVETINQAAESWGIHCLRYEIRESTCLSCKT